MAINLITRQEYKAYKGISSTNQDAAIDAVIPKVSKLIKTICKRTFVDHVNDPKTETFKGGTPYLLLNETPVIQVISVEFSADMGSTYTDLVEYTDYALDVEDDMIYPVNTTEFPKYINGYKVTYMAGFETVPEDLKLAALDLTEYYLRNDMAVHSPKAPGTNSVQIEYISAATLPAHIRRVLNQYMLHYG